MTGKSVKNANEIRAYNKTRASDDIYADICTVHGSNQMSFSTVCRWVKKFSWAWSLLKMHLTVQVQVQNSLLEQNTQKCFSSLYKTNKHEKSMTNICTTNAVRHYNIESY